MVHSGSVTWTLLKYKMRYQFIKKYWESHQNSYCVSKGNKFLLVAWTYNADVMTASNYGRRPRKELKKRKGLSLSCSLLSTNITVPGKSISDDISRRFFLKKY